jgi:DNA-binding GntR family transcriptional regulator
MFFEDRRAATNHPESDLEARPLRLWRDDVSRSIAGEFPDLAEYRRQAMPLRVGIAETLREAILGGELRPGQALIELDIAARFRVSRAPIREALRILAQEGLIETIPYTGTTVRRLTARDVEETYSLREQLEAFAIKRIIESPQPIDTSPLETLCASMEQAAARSDLKHLNSEDERFHRTMIRLARHELLMTMWGTVAMRVRQIISLRNERNRDLMEVAHNHPPIVAAIEKRDLAEALALMKAHILSAADLSTPIGDGEP